MTLQTRLGDFITAVGTDYKQLRTWISGSSTGTLSSLTTTTQASLVAAINEVNGKSVGTTPSNATTSAAGIIQIATLSEVSTGTDSAKAVTAAGVRQERTALKAEILGVGVPAALDTLKELADAIADDASYAATVTTALGNRVRTDTASQGLDTTSQSNARTNIAAIGTVDIGNPDTDLVALYTTAKS